MNIVNSDLNFIKTKNKFLLKTLIGNFNITLIDYDEYLLDKTIDKECIYPPSRHINFIFKSDDNFLIEDILFNFDSYFDFSYNDLSYNVIFHFFKNDPNYYNFDIKNILE